MPAAKAPSPAFSRSTSKGGRRRSIAQQVKDAAAAELHLMGYEVRDIAVKMGYKGPGGAWGAIQRGLKDQGAFKLTREETRIWVDALLRLLIRKQFEIVEKEHLLATPSGRVVLDPRTGEPALDDGPRHRAMVEIRQLAIQVAMLGDIKPPSRRSVETITRDVIEAKIEELETDLARNDPGT